MLVSHLSIHPSIHPSIYIDSRLYLSPPRRARANRAHRARPTRGTWTCHGGNSPVNHRDVRSVSGKCSQKRRFSMFSYKHFMIFIGTYHENIMIYHGEPRKMMVFWVKYHSQARKEMKCAAVWGWSPAIYIIIIPVSQWSHYSLSMFIRKISKSPKGKHCFFF